MQKDSMTWTGETHLISLSVEEKLCCAGLIQTFFCLGKRQSKDGISARLHTIKVSESITFPWKFGLYILLIERQLRPKMGEKKPLHETIYAK